MTTPPWCREKVMVYYYYYLQNDVCFNHLGEELWEKIHFLQPKVNFSGEGEKHINMNDV